MGWSVTLYERGRSHLLGAAGTRAHLTTGEVHAYKAPGPGPIGLGAAVGQGMSARYHEEVKGSLE
jgi:hypothetical protein